MDIATLRAARSIDVEAAAKGWTELFRESWQAVNDIHANGADPLKADWKDRVGEAAGQKLEEQARILEAGADTMRSVTMVLDGLGTAITRAKLTLAAAFDLAGTHGLVVDEATGRIVPGNGDASVVQEVDALIGEALREADQADRRAAEELRRLGGATCVTDPDSALAEQYRASRVELAMYTGGIPDGRDPRLVADWWAALPENQQRQLMLSDPVTIAGLPGIPEDVKLRLRGGPGAKYDPVKAVQWATEHWSDGSGDDADDADNCTNFVSEALHVAGVQYYGSSTYDHDNWVRGGDGSWLDLVSPNHSYAWGGAQNQHDFMLQHGGREVGPDEVRPGDIVYYEEDSDQDPSEPKGRIFHTALVTAVTPEGDVRYTSHNSNKLNADVAGRLPSFEESHGNLKVHYVRVAPDWY
ncbi:amidase domain-containing protein [Kitasatospora sp. NPDC093679]|uniref:amidase domain-containing protein n=1 Tax=Kitasatospora sp. NPDC093679 TaxID=3154983 RepID=UPI0034177EE4